MQKNIIKIALFITIVCAVEYFFGWRHLYEVLKEFAQTKTNPFVFILIMGVGCALGLPVSWCYFFSATAFGIWLGWGTCIAGIALSSLIGFAITKLFIPHAVLKPLLNKFKISLDESSAIYHANFFIRAIPGVPYFLQNVILASIRTPIGMYFLMTILVQAPIALAMCFFADALKNDAYIKVGIGILMIAVLVIVHKNARKLFFRKTAQPEISDK